MENNFIHGTPGPLLASSSWAATGGAPPQNHDLIVGGMPRGRAAARAHTTERVRRAHIGRRRPARLRKQTSWMHQRAHGMGVCRFGTAMPVAGALSGIAASGLVG